MNATFDLKLSLEIGLDNLRRGAKFRFTFSILTKVVICRTTTCLEFGQQYSIINLEKTYHRDIILLTRMQILLIFRKQFQPFWHNKLLLGAK